MFHSRAGFRGWTSSQPVIVCVLLLASLFLAADEPKPRAGLKGHDTSVQCIAFSSDSKLLASASLDCTLRIWDVGAGKAKHVLKGHVFAVCSVAFAPEGNLLASGGVHFTPEKTPTVLLWDAATGQQKGALLHGRAVHCLAFSPDGKRLASGGTAGERGGEVKVWDVESKKLLLTLDHARYSNVVSVAFSRDGKQLASGNADETIRIWDAQTGKEQMTLQGHEHAVNAVAFSPDDKMIVSGGQDQTVRLWSRATGKEIAVLKDHTEPVQSVGCSPDGKLLLTASLDGSVKLRDPATGKPVTTLKAGQINSVVFSKDGRLIAAGDFEGDITLWNR
jgi:WD40 repeat protein